MVEEIFNPENAILIKNALNTFILLGFVLALRAIFIRTVLKSQALSLELRRHWAVTIRNTFVLLLFVGLILIWAPQLRTLAVTLIAIAVALVFATKELLLCLSGTFLRLVTKAFSLGDRIEVNGLRGNVHDHSWLTTTLLEIGPNQNSQQYTGRVTVIPNSLFINGPLTNETYMKKYVLHTITIPLKASDDWQTAERVLLDAAKVECSPYLEDAKQHIMKQLEGKRWLDAPSVEPRVTIQLPAPEQVNLLLRIPCPAHDPGMIEQSILRRFLSTQEAATTEPTEKAELPDGITEFPKAI